MPDDPTPEPQAPPTPVQPPTWQERIDLLMGGSRPSPTALLGGGVAVVVALTAFLLLRPPPTPPPELAMPMASDSPAATSTTSPPEVVVHVAGAVVAPGVYRLPPLARVGDAVGAAGGPAPGADLDRLNLAALVADGAQVYVPLEGEPLPAAATAAGDAAAGPLDLNLASADQLEELPGVGPATAKAIVAARERLGGFRSVDDLLEVRGIGPAKLDAIRGLVVVR